jgi:hypothetical protein
MAADAVEVSLPRALLKKLAQFAAAQDPVLTVSYPNIDFVKPDSNKTVQWLRATYMPAETQTLGIGVGDTNNHYGLFQVDCFQGQGLGEPAPRRLAALVVQYFPRGLRLTLDGFNVDVIRSPFLGPLMTDAPWAFVPVRIPYQCLATPA